MSTDISPEVQQIFDGGLEVVEGNQVRIARQLDRKLYMALQRKSGCRENVLAAHCLNETSEKKS